ncbi:MAG: hypothetical protein EXQ92_05000 [Alphaproteobacteria bacterium]|nr:hypothetical protein [Alphaproteobacteria bacterium]
MNAVPFDTLKLADRLQSGGFTVEQAKAAATALADAMGGADLVTKEYLDSRLGDLEQRITIKMGSMMVIAVGAVAALVKPL